MNKFNILIIDDDTDFITSTKIMLEYVGYNVMSASDGHEGLEKALEEKPDLIILDVMMPGKDGYSVCREIKENPRICNIPIVIVTSIST
jgi:two-component system alkaline phosphatase synthesis response regulator PhoP